MSNLPPLQGIVMISGTQKPQKNRFRIPEIMGKIQVEKGFLNFFCDFLAIFDDFSKVDCIKGFEKSQQLVH